MSVLPARLLRSELELLDRLANEEFGLPGAVLMENAGRGAAEEVLELLRGATRDDSARRAVLFAGGGNNGGDACVVARHLANAGVAVELFATHALEKLTGDAARMRNAVERMGIPVHDVATELALQRARQHLQGGLEGVDVLVDGLLGTGFHGEMRPGIARIIDVLNAIGEKTGAAVVALDLPSGLDADTGRAARPTVVADVTVTFAAWKVGFDAPEARPFLGRVVLATIGAPASLIDRVRGTRAGS